MNLFKSITLIICSILIFVACRRHLDSNEAMVKRLERQQQFESNPANPYSCSDVLLRLDSIISEAKNDINIVQIYAKKANVLLQLGQEQKAVNLMDSLFSYVYSRQS